MAISKTTDSCNAQKVREQGNAEDRSGMDFWVQEHRTGGVDAGPGPSVRCNKRPMASVRRVPLINRQIVEVISTAGLDMLLKHATHLTEGQQMADGSYAGSTMLTIDLKKIECAMAETCDVGTSFHLARLIGQNADAMQRFRQAGTQHVQNQAPSTLTNISADVRVRAEAYWLFIDVEVEGKMATQPHLVAVGA